jgi:hypothetical protein
MEPADGSFIAFTGEQPLQHAGRSSSIGNGRKVPVHSERSGRRPGSCVEPGASRIVLVFCAPQITAWIRGMFGV